MHAFAMIPLLLPAMHRSSLTTTCSRGARQSASRSPSSARAVSGSMWPSICFIARTRRRRRRTKSRPRGRTRVRPVASLTSHLGDCSAKSRRISPAAGAFLAHWGIDPSNETRGGLLPPSSSDGEHGTRPRRLWLLQRKRGKHGASLGKTTGWIHRASLKRGGVEMIGGVTYEVSRGKYAVSAR